MEKKWISYCLSLRFGSQDLDLILKSFAAAAYNFMPRIEGECRVKHLVCLRKFGNTLVEGNGMKDRTGILEWRSELDLSPDNRYL